MELLVAALADVLKALLPEFMAFVWEKAHESNTAEDAAGAAGDDTAVGRDVDARRDRLLAAIRRANGGGGAAVAAPADDDGDRAGAAGR